MVHQKSVKAQEKRQLKIQQRLQAKQLLSAMNFHDFELAEIVHTVTEADVISRIQVHYSFVTPRTVNLICSVLKRYERGEIRVDSLGRGSVQQLRKHEQPFVNRIGVGRLESGVNLNVP